MDDALKRESRDLTDSWMRHDREMLRNYLVADVEDPRLNLQSILTRHWLTSALFGETYHDLARAELYFGATLNWLLTISKRQSSTEALGEIAYALRRGADNAEGLLLPMPIQKLFKALPATVGGVNIPNYIEEFLLKTEFQEGGPVIFEPVLETFQTLWLRCLSTAEPQKRPVLEPACGSANDYRFLKRFGLARFLDYTGFDICEKNISNALDLFPETRFRVGNVFEIGAEDRAYDFCFVHDLLEHLSPQGIQQAVRELCRVTRNSLCVHFFNMEEIDADRINPVDHYHWNLLSMQAMRERFAAEGFEAQVLNIGEFQRRAMGFTETHNPRAYTFLMQRG
jgi:SAM-dependent methyltransferase